MVGGVGGGGGGGGGGATYGTKAAAAHDLSMQAEAKLGFRWV